MNQPVLIQSSAHHEPLSNVSLPNPICWHEGMLLSPQHFQQNQQYWEAQLRHMVASLTSHYWGIGYLKLDCISLLEGCVRVLRLRAVMPDGLLIDYDNNKDAPLELELEEVDQAVTIQLTVPIQVPGSASERTEIQRYSSREDSPRIDENTGENEIVMPRLHAKLSLQAADRVSSRYVSLPILRVLKGADSGYQLDPNYCPPLLTISADNFRNDDEMASKSLQQRCQMLALTIRHKARLLAGLSDESENLGQNITQRHHRWIRAMVQDLVAFEQLSDDGNTLPADLYQGLVRMAGPVSELDPNSIPPRFPAYNHDHSWPGFRQALAYLHKQIEQVNLTYTTLNFEEDREGIFTLNYDKEWQGKDLLVELKATKSCTRQDLIDWFESCRIASAKLHRTLQKQRTLGAKAERIESDAHTGIVAGPGNVLFRIQANKAFIQPGTKLVITSTNSGLSKACPMGILLHMPHE